MPNRSSVVVPLGSFALAVLLSLAAGPGPATRLARAQGAPSGPCVPPAPKKKAAVAAKPAAFKHSRSTFNPATVGTQPPEGFPGLKPGEQGACQVGYQVEFDLTSEPLICKNKDGTCTVVAHALNIDVPLSGFAARWLPDPGSTALLEAHETGHAAVAEAGYDALVQKVKKELKNIPELSGSFTAATCDAAYDLANADLQAKIDAFLTAIQTDAITKEQTASDGYDTTTGKGTVGGVEGQAAAAKDAGKALKKAILGE